MEGMMKVSLGGQVRDRGRFGRLDRHYWWLTGGLLCCSEESDSIDILSNPYCTAARVNSPRNPLTRSLSARIPLWLV